MKNYTIASITRFGSMRFEILVNPEEALNFKSGKPVVLRKVLAIETVYSDAAKGMRASREDLIKAFGGTDIYAIAERILRKGKLQITAEQRRKMVEEKRQRIVTLITRNCIDPKTNLPIPRFRIEQAMIRARCKIDPFMAPEEQVKGVMDAIRPIIPIRLATVRALFRVPPQFAAKIYGIIKSSGSVEGEEWKSDGSLLLKVSMPAGLYANLVDRVSRMTQGAVEVKELG